MSTTNKGFLITSQGAPVTSGTAASGVVLPMPGNVVAQNVAQGIGTRVDSQRDLSTAGFAKNGAFYLNLAASTPLSPDLTAVSSVATSQAGDNSFATIYDLQLTNLGSQDVIMGNAASHPFLPGLGGTTPTLTIPAGGSVHLLNPAGWSVTSGTNSILKFDPGSSAAQLVGAIGGA